MLSRLPNAEIEPVMRQATIAGRYSAALGAIFSVIVAFGLLTQTEADHAYVASITVAQLAYAGFTWVIPRWRAWRARAQVTPVLDHA